VVKPRPCRVCRKWFQPDSKVGNRQHVCGSAACQRELHRRNCAGWHRRNPGLEKETRFEERLVESDQATQERLPDPLEAIDWPFAKEVIDLKTVILIRETGKVILQRVRDLSFVQVPVDAGISSKVIPSAPRDLSTGQAADYKGLSRKVIGSAARDEIGDRPPFP